jgi:hypothetical protein
MAVNTVVPKIKDVWASGEAYESYVGRWSKSGTKFLECLQSHKIAVGSILAAGQVPDPGDPSPQPHEPSRANERGFPWRVPTSKIAGQAFIGNAQGCP